MNLFVVTKQGLIDILKLYRSSSHLETICPFLCHCFYLNNLTILYLFIIQQQKDIPEALCKEYVYTI